MAAEQGNADAQFELANFYSWGYGVPQDDEEAVRWYRMAAEQYRMAAEQGDADAQIALGQMYLEWNEVLIELDGWINPVAYREYNDEEATRWHRMAAEEVAYYDEEATRWYRMAAEQGHVDAQLKLGWMYFDHRAVPLNYPLNYVYAKVWFILSQKTFTYDPDNIQYELDKRLSIEELAEAQLIANRWQPGTALDDWR